MADCLQELCNFRGVAMRVDRAAAVIRGVKVLGLQSRNGRIYLPDALVQAIPLYENAKVNVNHPKGSPAAPRDYQDRIGTIRYVAFRPEEGLFADFYFNPKHPVAEQLVWDAEHAPENVGFSHNVEARVVHRDGQTVVEAITRVQSVDLVADPATSRGLFEALSAEPDKAAASPQSESGETVSAEEHFREINRLKRELDLLRDEAENQRKQAAIRRLLRECGLPDPTATDLFSRVVCSERFLETLLAAPDEQTMRELAADRARLVRLLGSELGRTRAKDQHLLPSFVPQDTESFVKAIT